MSMGLSVRKSVHHHTSRTALAIEVLGAAPTGGGQAVVQASDAPTAVRVAASPYTRFNLEQRERDPMLCEVVTRYSPTDEWSPMDHAPEIYGR